MISYKKKKKKNKIKFFYLRYFFEKMEFENFSCNIDLLNTDKLSIKTYCPCKNNQKI